MISEKTLPCDTKAFAQISAELLKSGLTLRFTAKGNSMYPLIRSGDILMVKPVKPGQFQLADVVLFTNHQGKAVVHRVIRSQKNKGQILYTLQGDRVHYPDGVFTGSQIYGRLVELERTGVTINCCDFVFRLLGYAAVLRARVGLKQMKPGRIIFKVIKDTRLFRRYLN